MVTIRNATTEAQAVWDRLVRFDFDDPEHELSFTGRLARENGWTDTYTANVIDEYRRVCFLAIHSDHPVTPSEAVDEVWHLHLTYSRNYWEKFCPDVLGQALHHDPTQGGEEQASKFWDCYTKTLDSYQRHFGKPPSDI